MFPSQDQIPKDLCPACQMQIIQHHRKSLQSNRFELRKCEVVRKAWGFSLKNTFGSVPPWVKSCFFRRPPNTPPYLTSHKYITEACCKVTGVKIACSSREKAPAVCASFVYAFQVFGVGEPSPSGKVKRKPPPP
jgi:hypothetical protein